MNRKFDTTPASTAQMPSQAGALHAFEEPIGVLVRRVKAVESVIEALDMIPKAGGSVLLDRPQAEAVTSIVWDAADAARALERQWLTSTAASAKSGGSSADAEDREDRREPSNFIVDPEAPAFTQLEKMADALEELRAMARLTHQHVREIHAAVSGEGRAA